MSGTQFKKWIPKKFKRPVKDALLRRTLARAISKIAHLADGEIPNRELLALLIEGWSNEGFEANIEYLEEVARRTVDAQGNILECGSGVTTLLMGLLCAKRRTQVWSLENSVEWQDRVTKVLNTNAISQAQVCYSPLVEYGDFSWYDPPLTKLPQTFSLVICDGPPGTTKGGRYGLLPVMRQRFELGTIILLDDAGRPGEIDLIKHWQEEARFETTVVDKGGHVFAMMRYS